MGTSLASAIGITSVDVSAWAIAAQSSTVAGNSCIIALSQNDTYASRAFYLQGNGLVKGIGCDIQVNSCNTTDALYGQGNTYVELTGGEIRVCGEAKEQGPAYFIPEPLYPKKNNPANVVPDPYMDIFNPPGSEILEKFDDVSAPNDGDCAYTNYVSTYSAVELWPGTYCGGTADIHLSAPQGGDLPGFIFFGDRENLASGQHVMRGTPMGGYNGKIYLPKTEMLMQGTAGVMSGYQSDCTLIVADTFDFLGTPNFEAEGTCNDYGGTAPAGVATIVH